MMKKKTGETEREMSLRLTVVKKTLELLTSAFALVAALAWNDAVQTLFVQLFGPSQGVAAKFLYALLVTALVVWIGIRLSRLTKIIDKRIGSPTN
ncbi:hypothetical protein HY479_00110 [Candidatus Uhrbacteria bacterium]|nr:hypothetical protein [Candidatus Uhrbacteria bacterium]